MAETATTIDKINELLPLLQSEPARSFAREWLEVVTLELNEYNEWVEHQSIQDADVKLIENGGILI